MLLLGFIVEDSDLHLLKLDHEMLHYCLCHAEVAWDSGNRGKNGLETEEVLVGLSKLARLPSNRSLIVAKGKSQPGFFVQAFLTSWSRLLKSFFTTRIKINS